VLFFPLFLSLFVQEALGTWQMVSLGYNAEQRDGQRDGDAKTIADSVCGVPYKARAGWAKLVEITVSIGFRWSSLCPH
jgi:hypothetical protein